MDIFKSLDDNVLSYINSNLFTIVYIAIGLAGVGELIYFYMQGRVHGRIMLKASVVSYITSAINFAEVFLMAAVKLAIMFWFYKHRVFDLSTAWYMFIPAFFAYDFMYYVYHYLGHTVRLFWCVHSTHHIPVRMQMSVSAQYSFLEPFYAMWFFVWLPVLGFNPYFILASNAINMLAAFTHVSPEFLPSSKIPSFLRWFLVTPSEHRVHHGRNIRFLDRNFGVIFPIWDKLFGTYQLEDEEPDFGILKDLNHLSMYDIQLLLWADLWRDVRRSPDVTTALKYIFYPPGWTHDGEDLRVKTLRTQYPIAVGQTFLSSAGGGVRGPAGKQEVERP